MHYKNHKQFRLPGFDYSSKGDYFITICTKERAHHFGRIVKSKEDSIIELSPVGFFVQESILEIPDTHNKVRLGETVVMPNHVHLIITLVGQREAVVPEQSETQKKMAPTKGLAPLIPGSISSVINHFKGKVKKWCNANELEGFDWQSRFHDHIIRNTGEYNRISNYIANNIRNWDDDENNDDGINFRKDMRTR